MTFLFPGFLTAAGLVSLGVVVLHLIVTQQPKSELLPTVRFVPNVPAQATAVKIRPSDLWLLFLRVLTIMLIGAAFAQPQLTPKHQKVARLVVVDASRDVASMAEAVDSARRYMTGAGAVIVFDSVAHELPLVGADDSLRALVSRPRTGRRGALSAALVTTLRAASRVREGADSLDMIVVSPLVSEERDAATSAIRALWPGRVLPVRVAAASNAEAGGQKKGKEVKVQWADSGGKENLWAPRPRQDTVGAVRVGAAVLVYPFVRRWRLAVPLDSTTRVYARWVDGEPAAVERVAGGECVRSLSVTIPAVGDAILRPDFVRFTDGLKAPCGTARDVAPLPEAFLSVFRGPDHLAPVSGVKPRLVKMTPWVPWLLAAALSLALLELLVRQIGSRRKARAVVEAESRRRSARDAAVGRAA